MTDGHKMKSKTRPLQHKYEATASQPHIGSAEPLAGYAERDKYGQTKRQVTGSAYGVLRTDWWVN